MIAQQELTAQDIRATTQDISQEHLPLAADGYISSSAMLYDVLMKAASKGISIAVARFVIIRRVDALAGGRLVICLPPVHRFRVAHSVVLL